MGTGRPRRCRCRTLGFYARTIHVDQEGEWDYDTELKTSPSPAIRVGWLRAVLQGHQKVAAGLGLPMPVLVMTSAKTDFARKWHDGLHAADTVLDVEQIARRATKLGRHVTIVKFDRRSARPVPLPRRRSATRFSTSSLRWSGAYLTRAGPVLSDAAFDPVRGH